MTNDEAKNRVLDILGAGVSDLFRNRVKTTLDEGDAAGDLVAAIDKASKMVGLFIGADEAAAIAAIAEELK